ncbi:GTPases (dynamin-related) [Staphylococcus aureus]|uniref:GTPases (Dynamin-related) n=1 Tax=Staphylococcus aureus TaxID=1280 RepID=A0A380EK08_STAAU|nr:GTPases (dynamin-related) [Staphylococcus aureus]
MCLSLIKLTSIKTMNCHSLRLNLELKNPIADWGIKLERTFYVSKFDHPENELEVLSSYLISLDQHRETIEDYTSRNG